MTMSVGDVMSRFVVAVEGGASFTDVVDAMRRFHVDAVPVVDSDRRVLGVVSADDLLLRQMDTRMGDLVFQGPARRRERRKARGRIAADIMTRPAITVTQDTDLRSAARLMHKNRVRQLPVVDDPKNARIVGLVRQSDLLAVFCRSAEEIRDDVVRLLEKHSRECAVVVQDGVVSLTGSVERRSQLALLLEQVRRVDGVVDVECDLSFVTDDIGGAVPPPV